MIQSENEKIKQKKSCMVFKNPYHQEENTNGIGRIINYERQDMTFTKKF